MKNFIKVLKILFNLHPIIRMSSDLRKAFWIYTFFCSFVMILDSISSLLLQCVNNAFENHLIIVALILFIIFSIRNAIFDALNTLKSAILDAYDELADSEIPKIFTHIVNKVRGKVYNPILKTIKTDSTIMQEVIGFMEEVSNMRDSLGSLFCSIIIVTILSIGTVLTSLKNMNLVLIIMLIVFIIVYTYLSIREIKRNKKFIIDKKEIDKKIGNARNDFINIRPCSIEHGNYTRNRFIELRVELLNKSRKLRRKNKNEGLFTTLVMGLSVIVLIINQLYEIGGIDKFNQASLLQITAFTGIYMALLNKIDSLISRIINMINNCNSFLEYYSDFEKLIKVYDKIVLSEEKMIEFNGIIAVPPFEFTYDEGFNLKSNTDIILEPKKPLLLIGPSGSGKTTFMNIISKSINCNSVEIPRLNSYASRADTSFGTDSLFNEITLGNEFVDSEKLINILDGVNLLSELKEQSNETDIIEFLKNKYYSDFSEGQRQRLILTRMLYNCDGKDLVIVDEPTANLDSKNTEIALKFLYEYVSKDKRRILVVSTHDVSEAKNVFNKILRFEKISEGQYTIVSK